MSERPTYTDNNCFVCSQTNPIGLRIPYRMDGDLCLGEFTPGPNHVGWDDVTHGGILFSALDDVMANWLFLQGIHGHTARCDTRFRKPLRVGTPVIVEGRLLERRGRVARLYGEIRRREDNVVVAECEARFVVARDG